MTCQNVYECNERFCLLDVYSDGLLPVRYSVHVHSMIVPAVSVPTSESEVIVIPPGNSISVMSAAGGTFKLFPVQKVLLSC